MHKIAKGFRYLFGYLGFNFAVLKSTLSGLVWFFRDFRKFREEVKNSKEWPMGFFPMFSDKNDTSGKARGQYFYQDLFVAHKIYKADPHRHIDIGSRIDGFVAHVATFRKVEVMDIRPLKENLLNIDFVQVDLMQLDESYKESTDSLSCLHTIEHFGLGRYGDPIDYEGHLKGLASMYKMLKPGGTFYFSTQIGPQKVFFNAHRIFSMDYLLQLFKGLYKIESFSYIDDEDRLHENVILDQERVRLNFGCTMGCGIFILTKL